MGNEEVLMRIVTVNERPPIPYRKFDWHAFDGDRDVCNDPTCRCRVGLAHGFGETEHEAIVDYVLNLLDMNDILMREYSDEAR